MNVENVSRHDFPSQGFSHSLPVPGVSGPDHHDGRDYLYALFAWRVGTGPSEGIFGAGYGAEAIV